MGHLVSRDRPNDGSGEERRDVEDDRQVSRRAPQRADCSVQGPCPLHPPRLRPVQPLLVSALRGSVPCLPTSHLHPGPFYPSGYQGMIESDAGFLGNGSLQTSPILASNRIHQLLPKHEISETPSSFYIYPALQDYISFLRDDS